MKRLCFLILAFLSTGISYSQSNFSGKVVDAVSGLPVPDATLYLKELKKSVSCNEQGEFNIISLPDGVFNVYVSCLNYKSLNLIIEMRGKDIIMPIKLASNEYSTEEILVTETQVDKPYQTDKILTADLERNGSTNISDAVTKLPGVYQLSTGTGVSKPVIRGLYGNRVGVMINGMRFDNQQWQDEHGLVQSEDGLDMVEIIKGPSSLLYGPEAIGGVMNIIEEKPVSIGKSLADFNMKLFSSTLGVSGNVGFKGSDRLFNWRVRFGGETHADYLDGNNTRVPQTRFAGYNIRSSLGFTKSDFASALDYSFTNYIFGILEQQEFIREQGKQESRFERSFGGPHHILNVHNISSQNSVFSGKSKYKFNFGYVYNDRQEIEGNDDRFLPDSLQLGNLHMTLNTFSGDISWTYDLSRTSKLSIGTQGYTQTNRNYGQRVIVPDANTNQISGLANYKFSLKQFGAEFGMRYDLLNLKTVERGIKDSTGYMPPLDKSYNTVNGAFGMTYRLNNFLLVKGNFSTGYRSPNLAELTSNGLHEGTRRYEIGNQNFKTEQSFNGDIGFVIESKYFSLDFSSYYNKINNYIYVNPTNETIRGDTIFRFLQSDASLKGLEADLFFLPLNWLTYRITYSTVIGRRNDDSYLPLMPADRITNSLKAEVRQWKSFNNSFVELAMQTYLEKTRLGENEYSNPAYNIINLSIGTSFKFEEQLLNITMACTNLFNKVYTDFLSRLRTIGANNMGRNIVFSIKVPFNLSY